MPTSKLSLKLYLTSGATACDPYIPVFHDWIRGGRLQEVMIDVVDYAHVQKGPGVVLVCHEAQYSLEHTEGRPGLVLARRPVGARGQAGSLGEVVHGLFRDLFTAAALLEREDRIVPAPRFGCGEFVVQSLDRLRLPNTDEGFSSLRTEVAKVIERVSPGASAEFQREGTSGEALRLRVHVGALAGQRVDSLAQKL